MDYFILTFKIKIAKKFSVFKIWQTRYALKTLNRLKLNIKIFI